MLALSGPMAAAALTLHVAQRPMSCREMGIALEANETFCCEMLWDLEKIGLSRRTGAAGAPLWQAPPLGLERVRRLADIVSAAYNPSTLTHYLSRLHMGSSLEDCHTALYFIRENSERAQQDALHLYQQFIIDFLYTYEERHRNISVYDGQEYINMMLIIQILCFFSQPLLRKSFKLFPVASAMAVRFGNTRFKLIIDIFRELSRFFLGEWSNIDRKAFEREREKAEKLWFDNGPEGADMQNFFCIFEGFWAFLCGDFPKLLACYNKSWIPNTVLGACFFEMFTAIMIFSAGYVQQYHFAFAHLAGLRKVHPRTRHTFLSHFFRVNSCFLFLRKGDRQRALKSINTLLETGACETNFAIQTLTARVLALYHYLEGHVGHAFHVLETETRRIMAQGIEPLSFLDPLVLDLLYAFERHGYPSIPHYELSVVTRALLKSLNAHMRGAALRIHALRRSNEGASPKCVAAMLAASLRILIPSADPRETALTAYELARACRRAGLNERAQALYTLVCASIGQDFGEDADYHQIGIACLNATQDICDHFIQPDTPPPAEACDCHETQNLAAQCHREFHKAPWRASLSEQIFFLTKTVQTVLNAEQVFFFSTDEKGEFRCESPAIHGGDTNKALPVLRAMLEALESRQSWSLYREKRVLCLALEVDTQRPWFLYLENAFMPAAFVHLPPEEIKNIARVFAAELRSCLRMEALRTEEKALGVSAFQTIISRADNNECLVLSDGLRDLLYDLEEVGKTDAPILIMGETGVGKEFMARRVHQVSRRKGPFIAVQPASMPETLFASEFFGHEKGAFTGAVRQKIGLFELANQGTLFIDEIGEMPLSLQANFLRVLQEQCFMRVGGIREIQSNFRLVTATNRDLEKEAREGRFRQDLLYRIAVMSVRIPPLRERRKDIPPLIASFLHYFSQRYGKNFSSLTEEQLQQLNVYDWPGNVRELKNAIERITILGSTRPLFDTPYIVTKESNNDNSLNVFDSFPTLDDLEQRYLRHILRVTGGRVRGEKGAAELLQMKIPTLYAKLRKYGLLYGAKEHHSETSE